MDESTLRTCLSRISRVFSVRVEDLDPAWKFGYELKPSFVSDWRENELDQVLVDVQEMCGALGRGDAPTQTPLRVGEFCALAAEVSEARPEAYRRLAARWDKEAMVHQKPLLRRILYKVTGF